MKILSVIPRILREGFHPAYAIDFIERTVFKTPKDGILEPSKTISASDVLRFQGLKDLTKKTRITATRRISEVVGLSASKSDLSEFESLDDLAYKAIQEKPEKFDFKKNGKSFDEILELSCISSRHLANGTANFLEHEWDPRLFIINSDGSHSFAVARLMASLEGQDPEITMPLIRHEIDKEKLEELERQMHTFILQEPVATMNALLESLEMSRIKFTSDYVDLRTNGRSLLILGLDKENERAMKVAKALSQAGLPNFIEEVKKQRKHNARAIPPKAREAVLPDPPGSFQRRRASTGNFDQGA